MLFNGIIQPISKYYSDDRIKQLNCYLLANRNFTKKQKLASANARINELKKHR